MPTRIFNTPQRKRMVKDAKNFLLAKSWQVDCIEHHIMDLSASFSDIILHFSFLDLKNRNHIQNIGQQMASEAGSIFLKTGRPLIWILDAPFPHLELAHLLSFGIIAFEIVEMGKICEATSYNPMHSTRTDPRVKAIVSSSLPACMRIAEAFEASGDADSAVDWLNTGVKAFTGFSVARVKLFQLLLKLGELDKAYAVGEQALVLRPESSGLVVAMERLANRMNKPEEALKWQEWYKLKCQEFRPVTFDDIVKSSARKSQMEPPVRSGAALQSSEP